MFQKKGAAPVEANEPDESAPAPGKKCPTCGQVMPKAAKNAKTGGKPPGVYVKPAWQNISDKMTGRA